MEERSRIHFCERDRTRQLSYIPFLLVPCRYPCLRLNWMLFWKKSVMRLLWTLLEMCLWQTKRLIRCRMMVSDKEHFCWGADYHQIKLSHSGTKKQMCLWHKKHQALVTDDLTITSIPASKRRNDVNADLLSHKKYQHLNSYGRLLSKSTNWPHF